MTDEKRTFIDMGSIHIGGKTVDIKDGVYIEVKIETTGCTWDELHDALGAASSPRVKVQAKLRQMETEELQQLSKSGYTTGLKDLGIRSAGKAKVVRVTTLEGALEEFPDVGKFIQACESAGWLEMTSKENLVRLHQKHREKVETGRKEGRK